MVLRRKLPSQLEEKVKAAETETEAAKPQEPAQNTGSKMQKRTPKDSPKKPEQEKPAQPKEPAAQQKPAEADEAPAPAPVETPPAPEAPKQEAKPAPETPPVAHKPPEFLGGGSVDDVLNKPEQEAPAPVPEVAPVEQETPTPAVEEQPVADKPVEEEKAEPAPTAKPAEAPKPPTPVEEEPEAPAPVKAPPAPAAPKKVEPPTAPEEPKQPPAPQQKETEKPAPTPKKTATLSFDEEPEKEAEAVLPWVAAPSKIEDWDVPAAPEKPGNNGMPPWVQQEAGKGPSPTLPPSEDDTPNLNNAAVVADQYNALRNGALLILVGGILFGTYILFFRQQENTTEMLARWTGTLSEVSQEVPTEIEEERTVVANAVVAETTEDVLLPAPNVENEDLAIKPLPLEELPDVEETTIVLADPKPTAQEVLPPAKPRAEDVSLFASLQNAIKEAKKEKELAEDPATPTAKKEDRLVEGQAAEVDLEAELAAYRQQLASSGQNQVLPKPSSFFQEYKEEGRTVTEPLPTLPPVEQGSPVGAPLSPPVAYNSNPAGLPIVGEPKVVEKPSVRQLEDFDATMFAAAEPSVRIPKNLRPSMNATTFPALEILSMVPNRGVIALKDDQEGVLMIGETIEGWELISVYDEYAEFQKNNRRHIMTRN